MKHRERAYWGLALFAAYVLARAAFDVPVWIDFGIGVVIAVLILPTLFFRSAAAVAAVIGVFVLALPSFSTMDGRLGKSGLLFFFALWVILLLVVALERGRRRWR